MIQYNIYTGPDSDAIPGSDIGLRPQVHPLFQIARVCATESHI